MRALHLFVVTLLVLAPTWVFGQAESDFIVVEVEGVEYPSRSAEFGEDWFCNTLFGPLPIVPVEPADGCSLPSNAGDVFGSLALIERDGCTFAQKMLTAQAAGAAAMIVYNDDRFPDDNESLVIMGGDCPDCVIPGTFISRSSALTILDEVPTDAIVRDLLNCFPGPPPQSTGGTHDTGVVELDVFDYGFIGADATFTGTGFTFEGVNGLFVSSVLVSTGTYEVASNPPLDYSHPEWTAASEVESITAPFPSPFEHFDTGFVTSFESEDPGLFSENLGVLVTERSYSRDGDPFVIVELDVENTTDSDLEDVHIGLYAALDAGPPGDNDAAGVEEELNLVYVYDPVVPAPYYGVAAIGSNTSLSGYSADVAFPIDVLLFEALTTEIAIADEPAFRSVVIGVGPFDIPAGASVVAPFAFIGGGDEAELLENAEAAHQAVTVAASEATPEGTFVLEAVYPNPLSSQATISFELPVTQDVRLAVYDVLGREVAVLADGMRAAGEHAVAFDASALPSGVYLVRLEAGAVRLVERVTVVR